MAFHHQNILLYYYPLIFTSDTLPESVAAIKSEKEISVASSIRC